MKLTNTPTLLAACFGTALLASSAAAAPITVDNFSFETPDVTNDQQQGLPSGWTATGTNNINAAMRVRDTGPLASLPVPEGNQWGQLQYTNGTIGTGNNIVLSQDTGEVIQEGFTYTLTVAIGEQNNQFTGENIARIFLSGSAGGLASPFAIEDDIDPGATSTTSVWADFTTSFTATAAQAGQTLVIGLGSGTNFNSGTSNVGIDNVRLDAVVPEPGSLALLGLGGLLIARRRRG
ncbi:MAG: PEP-CTERM sorting domain-containing protein [Phycisphaeraceae bacterium]